MRVRGGPGARAAGRRAAIRLCTATVLLASVATAGGEERVPEQAPDQARGQAPGQVDARAYGERGEVQDWIEAVVAERSLDRDAVRGLMDGLAPNLEVLELIARPAEKRLEWRDYRPIFMTDERIAAGRAFMAEHAVAFGDAERRYGVPRHVVAAIIGVETFYGRITGRFPVVQALATLGFDYPPRSAFFRSELGEFLGLARLEGWDEQAILGSYAGAMGLPQFISSSYRRYAVDGDGDGVRDLFDSPTDVIASVANYLSENGWRRDGPIAERWWQGVDGAGELVREALQPVIEADTVRRSGFDSPDLRAATASGEPVSVMRFAGETGEEWVVGYNNFYAITRYNHSRLYARAVTQLAFALD